MTNAPTIWSSDQPPRLIASRDRRTGALRFPAIPASSPLAAAQDSVTLETGGMVYSYCVVHPNPKSGAQPFALGYVDLPGPVRIFGRIQGDHVRIGAACKAIADDQFGYVFDSTR